MSRETVWLCCGVLRTEMEELLRRGAIAGELVFLDSMLHMAPLQLEAALTAALERAGGKDGSKDGSLVLVYGDCCAGMLDLVRRFRVGRVNIINCAQLLLGRARYRELMHEEAFLVLPEWALRWETIMKDELGLSEALAHDLLGEHRRMLVYLDSGLVPVPTQPLAAFSSYTGLPLRVETVTLQQMLALLIEAQAGARLQLQVEE